MDSQRPVVLAEDVPMANDNVLRAFDEIRDLDQPPQDRAASFDFFRKLRLKVLEGA